MTTLQNAYGRNTGDFGIKGRFYGPQGHRGTDYALGRGAQIPIYEPAVCVDMGYSGILGHWVVLRLKSDGKYAGYAHVQTGTRPDIGQHLKTGQSIGRVAGSQDNPGSAWSGAHIHTTLSSHTYGIYTGWNLNPAPRIAAALRRASKPAGNKPKPVKPIIGDPMPKVGSRTYRGKGRVVPSSHWSMLPATTDRATYNLAKAPRTGEVGTITTWIKLEGLATGREVHFRLAVYVKGKYKRSYPTTEIIGTGGATLQAITQNYHLTNGECLRLEVRGYQDGIRMTKLHSEFHYWS